MKWFVSTFIGFVFSMVLNSGLASVDCGVVQFNPVHSCGVFFLLAADDGQHNNNNNDDSNSSLASTDEDGNA